MKLYLHNVVVEGLEVKLFTDLCIFHEPSKPLELNSISTYEREHTSFYDDIIQ